MLNMYVVMIAKVGFWTLKVEWWWKLEKTYQKRQKFGILFFKLQRILFFSIEF